MEPRKIPIGTTWLNLTDKRNEDGESTAIWVKVSDDLFVYVLCNGRIGTTPANKLSHGQTLWKWGKEISVG